MSTPGGDSAFLHELEMNVRAELAEVEALEEGPSAM
jgi:hypothetical protein